MKAKNKRDDKRLKTWKDIDRMRKNDFNTLVNGYKVAMKWLKDNATVTTFTLEWEQISSDNDCIIIVNSGANIDNCNQIQTRYKLFISNNEVIKVDYTHEQ